MRVNLTLRKYKNHTFNLTKNSIFALNFAKNEVLSFFWCKNYTIDNFTYMKPITGNVPGKITVIYTFYNEKKLFFLRVFAFQPKFFVVRTAENCL
jgi:hypothetical protein